MCASVYLVVYTSVAEVPARWDWPLEVIRGTQRELEVIGGHQRPFDLFAIVRSMVYGLAATVTTSTVRLTNLIIGAQCSCTNGKVKLKHDRPSVYDASCSTCQEGSKQTPRGERQKRGRARSSARSRVVMPHP